MLKKAVQRRRCSFANSAVELVCRKCPIRQTGGGFAMIICCIGDSLTEGDYGIKGMSGIGNVHKENYPYFLSQKLDCETRNFGKCGFRSSTYLAYYREGNVDLTGADFILVMLGTNGGQSSTEDSEENRAYITLIDTLKKDAPQARLVLITPPHATQNPEMSNCGYNPQVQEAAAFVRQVATKEGLPLIDAGRYEVFCAENEPIYQANDGLHFVEAGYKELAAFVAGKLKELFPDIIL